MVSTKPDDGSLTRTVAERRYGADPRLDLVEFVCADGVPARVLDVGCGLGATGAALKARGAQRVVGLESCADYLEAARAALDEVVHADLAGFIPPPSLGEFDCLLCADVLEHLADPLACLRSLLPLLAPAGQVVISIPNVNHVSVLAELIVRGDWRYRDHGVFDSTHLRFFTLTSAIRLLEQAGLQVVRHGVRTSAGWKMRLARRLTGRWGARFLAYQYYLCATRSGPPAA